MAHIRHIAIATDDTLGLAEFYKTAFGMDEVFRHESGSAAGVTAVYLSDGYLNLAILPATAAGRAEGMFHFGFQVDDVPEALDAAVGAGARPPDLVLPRDGRQAETFVTDPAGIRVDLSRGWLTRAREGAPAAEAVPAR